MEKFFHHLRENLEALQKDDDDKSVTESLLREIGQPERRRDAVLGDGTEEQEDSEVNLSNTSPGKSTI